MRILAGLICGVLLSTRVMAATGAGGDEVETLSLDRALELALSRNPTVGIAVAEMRRAHALVEQARSGALPSVAANASYTRLDANRVQNGVITLPIEQESANVSAVLPIVAPHAWASWWHANDAVRVATFSADEARRQLAIVVGRTYLSLVAQHRAIEIAELAQTNAQAHLDYTHARYVGGYGNRLDEVRAAQELATDQAQVESARVGLVKLREALGVLVAADHAVDARDDVSLPAANVEGAEKDGQSRRSDIHLFREKLVAARNLGRDNWADYAPALGITGSAFYQNPPLSTVPEFGWQVQLAITLPLYDGGLRYGQAKERNELVTEAHLALEGGMRQVSADVRAGDESLKRAAAAFASASGAAKLANEALSLATLAYKAGATTNIEVIDAERIARDADTSAVIAEDAARQAQLDLLIASGHFPER